MHVRTRCAGEAGNTPGAFRQGVAPHNDLGRVLDTAGRHSLDAVPALSDVSFVRCTWLYHTSCNALHLAGMARFLSSRRFSVRDRPFDGRDVLSQRDVDLA